MHHPQHKDLAASSGLTQCLALLLRRSRPEVRRGWRPQAFRSVGSGFRCFFLGGWGGDGGGKGGGEGAGEGGGRLQFRLVVFFLGGGRGGEGREGCLRWGVHPFAPEPSLDYRCRGGLALAIKSSSSQCRLFTLPTPKASHFKGQVTSRSMAVLKNATCTPGSRPSQSFQGIPSLT